MAIRAALEEELGKRGISPDPTRDELITRLLAAAQGPFASIHITREMWSVGKELVGAVREAFDGRQPEWLKPPPGRNVGIPTRGDTFEVAEVELTDGVQPLLASAFDALYEPEYDDDEEFTVNCKVWIDTRQPPAVGRPLPVILGSDLIGTLADDDALVLQGEVGKAVKKKQPLILEAEIDQEGDRFGVCVVVPPSS